jgi:hypothetical protein
MQLVATQHNTQSADTIKAASDGNADDFLPVMIINVLHARVANLHANVTYVRAMRHPSLSHAECDYYFTMLESAMAFLENADASCLNIDAHKFAECGRRQLCTAQRAAAAHPTCLKYQLASLGRSCGVRCALSCAGSSAGDVDRRQRRAASVAESEAEIGAR